MGNMKYKVCVFTIFMKIIEDNYVEKYMGKRVCILLVSYLIIRKDICSYFLGKTHFKFLIFLFFSTFHHYTFILKYCILILLFSYRFRPSVPQLERVEITLMSLNTQYITCILKIKKTIKK